MINNMCPSFLLIYPLPFQSPVWLSHHHLMSRLPLLQHFELFISSIYWAVCSRTVLCTHLIAITSTSSISHQISLLLISPSACMESLSLLSGPTPVRPHMTNDLDRLRRWDGEEMCNTSSAPYLSPSSSREVALPLAAASAHTDMHWIHQCTQTSPEMSWDLPPT